MSSKIEWLKSTDGKPGYTINPVKGLCPMACPYCYARRIYKRFGWEESIRFYPEVMSGSVLSAIPEGSKVFVGSTMELFGDWIQPEWLKYIFDMVKMFPKLTFIFLTKQPQNLIKWSPYPANCWVGFSATNQQMFWNGVGYFDHIRATVKFVSFEPLQSRIYGTNIFTHYSEVVNFQTLHLNWIICGQQTPASPKTTPKIEWIKEIVEAADNTDIPVFLKDNLKPILPDFEYPWAYKNGYYTSEEHPNIDRHFRQEFPKE
jgi:protein gp37